MDCEKYNNKKTKQNEALISPYLKNRPSVAEK